MKFPQTFIDEVQSAADIVAVIPDTIALRKAGSTYKGLCPFHGEKTPSFNVMRERGFFHCSAAAWAATCSSSSSCRRR